MNRRERIRATKPREGIVKQHSGHGKAKNEQHHSIVENPVKADRKKRKRKTEKAGHQKAEGRRKRQSETHPSELGLVDLVRFVEDDPDGPLMILEAFQDLRKCRRGARRRQTRQSSDIKQRLA